jgi:hypothetical protein
VFPKVLEARGAIIVVPAISNDRADSRRRIGFHNSRTRVHVNSTDLYAP